MAELSIVGSGHNSTITLYKIHNIGGSFRKDTATTHSQVQLIQEALTTLGYDTKGADGKFGDNTLAAVKSFQRAKGLTVDGYFGKNSLITLEADLGGGHLDSNCTNSSDPTPTPGGGTGSDVVRDYAGKTYKKMLATRVNSCSEALEKIYAYYGDQKSLSVPQYIANLQLRAENEDLAYTSYDSIYGRKLDCSGFTMVSRNDQGYHGATTNFCEHLYIFGSIQDLGRDNLIEGMELYEAYRKTTTSPYFYAKHTGVYAGKHDFGDGKGLQHAVYQSASSYSTLTRTPRKNNGPALTAMTTSWTYWGWSKYIILD